MRSPLGAGGTSAVLAHLELSMSPQNGATASRFSGFCWFPIKTTTGVPSTKGHTHLPVLAMSGLPAAGLKMPASFSALN